VQSYFSEMVANPAIMAKLAAFGLHNYAGYPAHAEAAIQSSAYPGKNFWMTEVTNIWDALPEIAQGAATPYHAARAGASAITLAIDFTDQLQGGAC